MSKIAHYLQEHLVGEVMTSTDARRYFATDMSIFNLPPALVVYPRNENDVRKTARFTWQLAERGRVIPITARGSGTDTGGGALGGGIMMAFPAHMNRILELDTKSGMVNVEPGLNYGKLQQTLHTHHMFLPPYPASLEYSTIGGAVANNASGEKSVKYGDTRNFVNALRVVLANGEVLLTGRLSKRELGKKLGLATFEGEVYRQIDTLLDENNNVLQQMRRTTTKNTAGYDVLDIKRKDGSFDLTPLFVGSQGTLGIITEVSLVAEPYNPETTLFLALFDSMEQLQNAVLDLRNLSELPSAVEMVDANLLDQVQALNPNHLSQVIQPPFATAMLFVEFDAAKDSQRKKLVKKAGKIFEKHASSWQAETESEAQQKLWKIRQTTALVSGHNNGTNRSLPIIDDATVPVERLREYIDGIYALFKAAGLKVALWGHAGDGNLHVQPQLDIGQVGDRQKAFKLMDEMYKLVLNLGGTTSGEYNDGRLRTPYLEQNYGTEVYQVLQKLKLICDPYGTLNPGVKFGTTKDDLKAIFRDDYTLEHLYDHLPMS
jgi:FAD/FMN-containing dehydrogenase